jgi:type II secretory ATPase GspE/PulE/Tfp pilus assembly ATPase PilB-like protein
VELDDDLQDLVKTKALHRRTARSASAAVVPVCDALELQKILSGVTTVDEVLRVTS